MARACSRTGSAMFIIPVFPTVDVTPKIIVGLGNPGKTYENTRHNAGFMVADRLAAHWGCVFKADKQRKCELAAGPGVLLVKPDTFMNESVLRRAHDAVFQTGSPQRVRHS
ncbi:MAG: hypothetical protein ACLSUW_05165 [Akkermansia sp.]